MGDEQVGYMRGEDFLKGGVPSTAVERAYERIDWDRFERESRLRRMRGWSELSGLVVDAPAPEIPLPRGVN